MAYQCFKLTLTFNNDHAEAYNNLSVLELRKGRVEQVRTFFFVFCFLPQMSLRVSVGKCINYDE